MHCKKELAIFPSPAGMSLIKLSLGGKKLNYSRPGRVWSVTSRLGTGKRPTLFYSAIYSKYKFPIYCQVPLRRSHCLYRPLTFASPEFPHCRLTQPEFLFPFSLFRFCVAGRGLTYINHDIGLEDEVNSRESKVLLSLPSFMQFCSMRMKKRQWIANTLHHQIWGLNLL